MATKLIINGRVRMRSFQPGETLRTQNPIPALDDGQLERQAEALGLPPPKRAPALVPALPKEDNVPWYDPHDRVTYRVVDAMPASEGWGTLGFWMRRWGLPAEQVLRLARNRHLDAATEKNSAVKRYRCPDESRTLRVIHELKRTLPAPPAPAKTKKGTTR